jgi:hypothetical protein
MFISFKAKSSDAESARRRLNSTCGGKNSGQAGSLLQKGKLEKKLDAWRQVFLTNEGKSKATMNDNR